jgi:tRNA modification GTPase
MHWQSEDTIVAIASAAGGGLRGIVRMSGANCLHMLQPLLQDAWSPHAKHATTYSLQLHLTSTISLPALVYFWPTNRSYTRQPTIEIHTVGSPPLLDLLLRTLCQHGARLAEPGEFTLRAFLAGRLDLTQAEAVLGVIDAESEHALQVALRQLAGGMAQPLLHLRNDLLNLLADVEAELDFVEEDIEFVSAAALRSRVQLARDQTQQLLQRLGTRETVQQFTNVVLYGSPNAGKSSLFNAMTREQRALVSSQAGTTRDYLTAEMKVAGVSYNLIDTAGAEETPLAGSPAAQAQTQLREQQSQAHVRLLCIDATQPLDPWTTSELSRLDAQRLVVLTKCEASGRRIQIEGIHTSSATGLGIDLLLESIAKKILHQTHATGEAVDATAVRCRESLTQAVEHLDAALLAISQGLSREFLAGDLRLTLDELGRVAGVIVTDDILDRIFSRFCIGK